MKILITYPPIETKKGVPLLSQNRQFQYFKTPTFIYPVVPAYAATLLKQDGFDVFWKDCIAERIGYEEFFDFVKRKNPDLIAIETKTPVVKQHWDTINKLKLANENLKIILFGDHVTALPEESFENSKVDFVLTGGDYDFLLLNLANVLRDRASMTTLESGIYYREGSVIKNSGKFKLNHNLDSLPFIDRELTNWRYYAYKNGNFKRTPGAYIMSGRDCWWSKCSFCSWSTLYPTFRVRSPENVLSEIEELSSVYGVREIMDDTGTFPTGRWLFEFCQGMIKKKLNKRLYIDCNMRFGALNQQEYSLMKKAGFRLILFGLESANQKTLDKINKNLKVEEIISSCKMAKKAGLFPHITLMFGYPWETLEEAKKTLKLGQWLLNKGFAYTMQATIVIPYPGSALYKECAENDLLNTYNWSDYDMKSAVMKLQFPSKNLMRLVQEIYSVSFTPKFIFNKLISIRDVEDVIYFIKAFFKVIGHIFDFAGTNR